MRSLLTGGIKAILAIAALSTAAHWALRIQRDSENLEVPVVAGLIDPVTTGSIAPAQAALPPAAAPAAPAAKLDAKPVAKPVAKAAEAVRVPTPGLDQSHLAALMASASSAPKAKVAKR